MKYVEYSLSELEIICNNFAQKIKKEYQPDLIIYIAKGGYIIAKEFSKIMNVPFIEIHSDRSGNSLKEKLIPLLSLLPTKIKVFLRMFELKLNIHKTIKKRNVYWENIHDLDEYSSTNIKNILLIDDSVDTGYSMINSIDIIKEKFGNNVSIKTATINTWDKSNNLISIDYSLFTDTILLTPMSKDSKEYSQFIKLYERRNYHIV